MLTAREKLEYLATRDPLTWLVKPSTVRAHVDREFARSKMKERDLTVVFIDCDAFNPLMITLSSIVG